MKKYTIVANEGWESGEMSYHQALIYAGRLRMLGNVNVWVRIKK